LVANIDKQITEEKQSNIAVNHPIHRKTETFSLKITKNKAKLSPQQSGMLPQQQG